jgi:hypothetical protein
LHGEKIKFLSTPFDADSITVEQTGNTKWEKFHREKLPIFPICENGAFSGDSFRNGYLQEVRMRRTLIEIRAKKKSIAVLQCTTESHYGRGKSAMHTPGRNCISFGIEYA